jgi:uncharacterized SAM-binding protein YcdF (DUF218 family)
VSAPGQRSGSLRRLPVEWLARADAIVILGAPLTGTSLSPVVEERVRAGVDVWRRGLAPLVCVTGGGPRGRVEADAMAARALELGVPAAALRIERRARSTEENARLSAAALRADACTRVWLVTQPFHLRRAIYCFRRAGLEPLGWHVDGSLQYRQPGRALRWIAREYAAWGLVAAKRALGD